MECSRASWDVRAQVAELTHHCRKLPLTTHRSRLDGVETGLCPPSCPVCPILLPRTCGSQFSGRSSVTACTVPRAAEELGEVGCASGTIGALQGVGFGSAERAQRLWGQDTATCLGKLEGQTAEQAGPRSVDLARFRNTQQAGNSCLSVFN